ncbi:MAG TPA: TetR/AcrR family transcriptional regulator, partial [Burkholderiaceae bacterium]|nr:TetR/AcrR family transcriptional regulator [Burkholderiaceae bacterium]
MVRGRALNYDTQRAKILSIAAELFANNGYVGTSMNDVAQACNMSKPALYHYVMDKSQLLFEIASTHVTRLLALVDEVKASHDTSSTDAEAEAMVRCLIERFVIEYAQARHAHRVLTEDVKFLAPESQAIVLKQQRQIVNAFALAIAKARPGIKKAKLHKPLTMLLFGMMNWLFTWLKPTGKLTHADMAPMV